MLGVKVTVTNEGTNISKTATTAANGSYEATHLNPGLYTVAAESPGFQRYVHERVIVETDRILRLDIRMNLGQVSDTITVTGQTPAVESETATISDLRTGRSMREAPLNFARGSTDGGNLTNLALSAGAFNYEGFWLRSFAGSRGNQNSYMMDGTSLGGIHSIANTASQPNLESVQEMKVAMVNNSAEYGAVATVTVSSRSDGRYRLDRPGDPEWAKATARLVRQLRTGIR